MRPLAVAEYTNRALTLDCYRESVLDTTAAFLRVLGATFTAATLQVPVWLLKATRSILKSFQWARDAADRLVSTTLHLSCHAPQSMLQAHVLQEPQAE